VGEVERGLVISAPTTVYHDGSGTIHSSDLDNCELKAGLLFWDKFDFPTSNLIHIELTPDCQYLEEIGVLQRTRLIHTGAFNFAGAMLETQRRAFEYLEQSNPGQWTISAGRNTIVSESMKSDDGRGVIFKLYNALPVPSPSASFDDVLQFKARRESELLALRNYIDELYLSVVGSSDSEFALRSLLGKLESSVADYIKTTKEEKLAFGNTDIEFSWSTDRQLFGGAAGFLLGNQVGLDQITSALCGVLAAASATLTVKTSYGLKKRHQSVVPFSFVASYVQEL
jgi:Family of unknown function (DUF6236)